MLKYYRKQIGVHWGNCLERIIHTNGLITSSLNDHFLIDPSCLLQFVHRLECPYLPLLSIHMLCFIKCDEAKQIVVVVGTRLTVVMAFRNQT